VDHGSRETRVPRRELIRGADTRRGGRVAHTCRRFLSACMRPPDGAQTCQKTARLRHPPIAKPALSQGERVGRRPRFSAGAGRVRGQLPNHRRSWAGGDCSWCGSLTRRGRVRTEATAHPSGGSWRKRRRRTPSPQGRGLAARLGTPCGQPKIGGRLAQTPFLGVCDFPKGLVEHEGESAATSFELVLRGIADLKPRGLRQPAPTRRTNIDAHPMGHRQFGSSSPILSHHANCNSSPFVFDNSRCFARFRPTAHA
jgi:hypothetical protein